MILHNITEKGVTKEKDVSIENLESLNTHCHHIISIYNSVDNCFPLLQFQNETINDSLNKEESSKLNKKLDKIYKMLSKSQSIKEQPINIFLACAVGDETSTNNTFSTKEIRKLYIIKARILDMVAILSQYEDYDDDITLCLRQYRMIVNSKNIDLIKDLPNFSGDNDYIIKWLDALEESKNSIQHKSDEDLEKDKKDARRILVFKNLFKLFDKDEKVRHKRNINKTAIPNIEIKKATIKVNSLAQNKETQIFEYREAEISDETINIDLDERMADQSRIERFYKLAPTVSKSINKSISLKAVLAKNQVTHIQRGGKSTISDYSNLTFYEANSLAKFCLNNTEKNHGCLYLLLSLLLGKSIEKIYEMLLNNKVILGSMDFNLLPTYVSKPDLPLHEIEKKFESFIDRSEGEIVLMFPAYFRMLMDLSQIGSYNFNEVLEDVQSIIKNINKSNLTRLTVNRIEKYFEFYMKNEGVDSTEIAFICGHNTYYTPGTYYYKVATQKLLEIHNVYLNKMLLKANQSRFEMNYESNQFIGSNLVLKEQGFCDFIKKFQIHLEDLKKCNSKKLEFSEEHHNLFVLYSILILNLATGHRSVRDPYETLDTFDLNIGTVLINDKEVSNMTSYRLIVLPKTCVKLLKKYINHLKELKSKVTLKSSLMGKSLDKILAGKEPLFFFINDLKLEPVIPSSISEYFKDYWPFPLNWNRHFMRTYLRNNGFSGDIVDSWMGHEINGDATFEEYSGMSVSRLKDIALNIEKFLIEKLEINFAAI